LWRLAAKTVFSATSRVLDQPYYLSLFPANANHKKRKPNFKWLSTESKAFFTDGDFALAAKVPRRDGHWRLVGAVTLLRLATKAKHLPDFQLLTKKPFKNCDEIHDTNIS